MLDWYEESGMRTTKELRQQLDATLQTGAFEVPIAAHDLAMILIDLATLAQIEGNEVEMETADITTESVGWNGIEDGTELDLCLPEAGVHRCLHDGGVIIGTAKQIRQALRDLGANCPEPIGCEDDEDDAA